MKLFYLLVAIGLLFSCKTNNSRQDDAKDSVIFNYEHIPTDRTSVNPKPVKTYSETVKSFETTDQFIVSLYETEKTFSYLIKIQYKNLKEEDTLKVPNFGGAPSVDILKGDKRPSCIVGFLDKDKKFRESKLVYFEGDKLRIHVLKRYAVSIYQDTVKTGSE